MCRIITAVKAEETRLALIRRIEDDSAMRKKIAYCLCNIGTAQNTSSIDLNDATLDLYC